MTFPISTIKRAEGDATGVHVVITVRVGELEPCELHVVMPAQDAERQRYFQDTVEDAARAVALAVWEDAHG